MKLWDDELESYRAENRSALIHLPDPPSSAGAPSDGPLPGILFYHDRNGSGNITHNLTGGANMQLNGIIYFPTSELNFTGGSALTDSASIIIADKVTFSGDVHLGDFSSAPGNAILGNALMLQATLVE